MYNPNTTDNQEEVYDIVNELDEVVGTATRGQVHTNPSLIHRAIGAYIFNDKKEILLQKRSMSKDTSPGKWMLSVGGHVDSGSDYVSTAHREIQEELGVDIPLVEGEKILVRDDTESEYWMTYVGICNGPFPNFNKTEAEEVRFFNIQEALRQMKEKTIQCVFDFELNMRKAQELIDSGLIDALIQGREKEQYV